MISHYFNAAKVNFLYYNDYWSLSADLSTAILFRSTLLISLDPIDLGASQPRIPEISP